MSLDLTQLVALAAALGWAPPTSGKARVDAAAAVCVMKRRRELRTGVMAMKELVLHGELGAGNDQIDGESEAVSRPVPATARADTI